MKTITIEELLQLDQNTITVLDVRPADAYTRGSVPGAVSIPLAEVEERMEELPKEKPVYVLCHTGEWSVDAVYELEAAGYDAANIEGGYRSFLRKKLSEFVQDENTTGEKQKEIERSIIKKFRKGIWRKFTKGIREYDLIQDGDKIAVCISGGKDSMLMAKLFQELKKHNKFPFEVEYLVMDPGYSELNRKLIEQNAKMMGIPIKIFESDIFDAVFDVEKSPCYLCARMRRGHLYSKAKELGCNKIALGHHYDDVIETILMGMLYGAQVQTMMPKLHSTNFEGMELIRPLYLVREDDIKHWRDYNHLHFLQCACRFTETCSTCSVDGSSASKRMEIKHLIAKLKETNPYVEGNIFKSVENVNLSTVIAYKENGVKHHFLESYDEKAFTHSHGF